MRRVLVVLLAVVLALALAGVIAAQHRPVCIRGDRGLAALPYCDTTGRPV